MPEHRVTFEESRPGDFELMVGVGDRFSEHGLTSVRLDGTGHVVVEHQREEKKGAAGETTIGREEALSLLKRVSQFDWSRRFPSRPGLPDEAVVEWSLRDREGDKANLKAWLREVEQDAVMGPVLSVLRSVVEKATKGEHYL